MRRLRLVLTLPLLALLLLAQQGAMLHGLSHLRPDGREHPSRLRVDSAQPGMSAAPAAVSSAQSAVSPQVGDASATMLDDGGCPLCQAFAQVAHPAAGLLAYRVDPPAAFSTSPPPLSSAAEADAPTPHSRGPPPQA